MNIQALALAFLAAAAVGGISWVFLYPMLSGERKAEHRRASVAKSEPAARNVDKNQRSRREQVEGSLKDLEARRQKEKKIPLSSRITQAGLTWTTQKFMVASGVLAAVAFAIAMLAGGGLIAAVGLAFAAGFGLPRWALSYLKKRREKAFLKALPDAVDVIVRGIKAGLPLFESIKVVAADAPEPLKGEFLRDRDRDPAKVRRQPVGGLGQPVQGAARSQEDGREDSGDVDGSQGVRGHYRLVAADRHAAGLPFDPRLHLAAVDPSGRSIDAGWLRGLDVHRHFRNEENDQLRLLMVQHV